MVNENSNTIFKPKEQKEISSLLDNMPTDDAIKMAVRINNVEWLNKNIQRNNANKNMGVYLTLAAINGYYEIVKTIIDNCNINDDVIKKALNMVLHQINTMDII